MGLKQRFNPGHFVSHMDQSAIWDNGTNMTTTVTEKNVTALPISNTTGAPIIQPPCQWILYKDIGHSRVRIWDLTILVPNILFLLFLLLRLRTAIAKLHRTSSPIFFTFYAMVLLVGVISVLRCVVSMTVNAAMPAGDIADKVLWLVLRFFLLATELSVVIFGLAFGHLDSKTSIRRVLLVTSFIALAYSCTQGALEFLYPDDRFHVQKEDMEYEIFGHGGMLFWFASSIFFFFIYFSICIMPFTRLRQRFALPTKRSFYWYCGLLAGLNLVQAVGSGLLFYRVDRGMCVVDVTAYLYFTCFAPLVYGTFLRDFFATTQPPNILFSYKAQVDELQEEDTVSLPHQIYAPSNVKNDSYSPHSGSYDSTHFDSHSPNPLYASDLPPPLNAQLTFNSDFFGNGVIQVDDEIGPTSRYTSINT